MTAEDHLLFSIVCVVFTKNAELTLVLMQSDWWCIVPSAVLTCLLPDIDHPEPFLDQRSNWISRLVARVFGHRGFTHNLLAVFGALTLFYLKVPDSWIVPADTLQGLVLSCLSHIPAGMFTLAGVPLLQPCRWRFRLLTLMPRRSNQLGHALCMALFVYTVWMPQMLAGNSTIRWFPGVTNSLQIISNRFISHQSGR